MMLSPRALQQGWKEELDSNIGQHKEWITKRKLEAVFDAGLPARELEEEVGAVVCSYTFPLTPISEKFYQHYIYLLDISWLRTASPTTLGQQHHDGLVPTWEQQPYCRANAFPTPEKQPSNGTNTHSSGPAAGSAALGEEAASGSAGPLERHGDEGNLRQGGPQALRRPAPAEPTKGPSSKFGFNPQQNKSHERSQPGFDSSILSLGVWVVVP